MSAHGAPTRITPGVAEPRTLLHMPMDLSDGVVDIEQRTPRARVGAPSGAAGVEVSPNSRVSPDSAIRKLQAIASSWRTWPKVKARRNDPNVEGA